MDEYKFCDISDVIALTRMGDGYTGYNNIIQTLLPQATGQIQQYCRRSFIRDVYTEYFPTRKVSGRPTKIWLDELNILTEPAPVVKLDYGFPLDWSAIPVVDPTYYRVDYKKSMITLLMDTWECAESLQVTYTAGYPIDTVDTELVLVPSDLVQAAAIQCAYMLNLIVNQDIGQTAKNSAGVIKTLKLSKSNTEGGLVPQAGALVQKYRRQLIGKY